MRLEPAFLTPIRSEAQGEGCGYEAREGGYPLGPAEAYLSSMSSTGVPSGPERNEVDTALSRAAVESM
jgi:hypothetical protein